MTEHTEETWAAHREHRARYDAVHAQLEQIADGMESVTNPKVRELLEMLQSLLRDILGICESSEGASNDQSIADDSGV